MSLLPLVAAFTRSVAAQLLLCSSTNNVHRCLPLLLHSNTRPMLRLQIQHCIPHDRSEDLRAEAAVAGEQPAAAAAAAAAATKEEDEEQAGAAGMDVDVAGKEGGLPGSGAQPAE